MNIREKMHSGDLYLSMDEDLFNEQLTYLDKLYDFNATRPLELAKRTEIEHYTVISILLTYIKWSNQWIKIKHLTPP